VTPRGDALGFVRVADERTLILPDRRGNNRLDALRDILNDRRVALLFLLPGVAETLRVQGTARIPADPALPAAQTRGGVDAAELDASDPERMRTTMHAGPPPQPFRPTSSR
jgi:predicted pyridoxine 5'-phosphate oxidase superfamily flavin-nucleotide-binding protein